MWKTLISYLSMVERVQIEDREIRKEEADIMNYYIRRNRRVTYFFWTLAFLCNISIFTEPYRKNRAGDNGTIVYFDIFDGYTPFSREPPGYYCSMVVQTVLGHVASLYVVGWDTMVVGIMIYFAGQLEILRNYAKYVISPNNVDGCHKNIVKCHKFYLELIKHQKIFNDLIYPIMFVYLIVIAINLSVCIIQIVEAEDLAMLFSSCLFLLGCLIQLLVFYWYGNEVTVESSKVSYGLYQSHLFDCDQRLKKEIYLLGESTNRRLVFKAGPFNEMSLTTFVSILRSSYSFYTLLNNTK